MKKTNFEKKTSEIAARAENMALTFSLLATLLNKKPDVELVRNLRLAGVVQLKNSTGNSLARDEMEQALQYMTDFIETTASKTEEEVETTLAVDWTRLFRGVSPSYGPPPPYEGMFRPDLGDHLEVMKIVIQAYRASGVLTAEECSNRPDYLGIEFGFLSFLATQETKAYVAGQEMKAKRYAAEADEFMDQHLGQWVRKFVDAAHQYVNTDFYRGVLVLIQSVVPEQQALKKAL